MIEILHEAWKTVEKFYWNKQINSEHCLQAVLYHAFRTSSLPETDTILVEPGFGDKYVPDIVIRDDNKVKCIIEIKCSPHYKVPGSRLYKNDLEKLIDYSKKEKVGLDMFGPGLVYNEEDKPWNGREEFEITPDTWYVFAVLTPHDNSAASLEKIEKDVVGIRDLPHFCLLVGAMNPKASQEEDRCRFCVKAY